MEYSTRSRTSNRGFSLAAIKRGLAENPGFVVDKFGRPLYKSVEERSAGRSDEDVSALARRVLAELAVKKAKRRK